MLRILSSGAKVAENGESGKSFQVFVVNCGLGRRFQSEKHSPPMP